MGRPNGLPKTGGRKKGTPNRIEPLIRPLAQRYGPDCIHALARIVTAKQSTAAAVISASTLLLAYGYGKPAEMHEVSGQDGTPIPVNSDIVDRIRAITERLRSCAVNASGSSMSIPSRRNSTSSDMPHDHVGPAQNQITATEHQLDGHL